MTRKTKNTQGRAAEEAKPSTAAGSPEGPAPDTAPAEAEAAVTASAPDPEGQAADQGAQTSAAAEGPAQGPEATKAPAKTGEADAGSPAPGSEADPVLSSLTPEALLRGGPGDGRAVLDPVDPPDPSGLEVVVVGPKRGRWRAGRHFGAEPVRIPVEELTEDEKAALLADPVLIVSVAEVSRRP